MDGIAYVRKRHWGKGKIHPEKVNSQVWLEYGYEGE